MRRIPVTITLDWLYTTVNALGLGYSLYGLTIACHGALPESKLPSAKSFQRFAILIPAHNEAFVLQPLLESLEHQRYPREQFDVYVAADHCTDETAEVARAANAVVLERTNQVRRGKTWNVRWALEHLPLSNYEAVVFFDADNLAHPDFLSAMNDYLAVHPEAEAVQGNLDVKNPNDNWLTRAIAVSYWFTNRFAQLARSRLGLSCMLGGTGMLIRSGPLVRHVSRLESLVDDLELTVLLTLEGQAVGWNEQAIVFDEKPLELATSLRQRQRWMQGHFWVLARYGSAMLRAWFKSGRLLYFDAFLMLASPALSLLGLLFGLLAAAHFWQLGLVRVERQPLALLGWVLFPLAVAALQSLLGPSARFGRVTTRYLRSLPGYIAFGLSWFWAIIGGLWMARHQGHWAKTEHTRSVTASELE